MKHRPIVSDDHYKRLDKYSGDHFDDKLGNLLLIKELHAQSVDRLESELSEMTDKWIESDDKRLQWKVTAIFLLVVCIGLFVEVVG